MFPPLFETVKDDTAVRSVFGTSPRVFPHGMAPDTNDREFAVPYAVHRIIGGTPENYIGGLPDSDDFTTLIEVYAKTVHEAANGARVLRDALEPVAHVVGWLGQVEDPDTKLFRYSFVVDWITPR